MCCSQCGFIRLRLLQIRSCMPGFCSRRPEQAWCCTSNPQRNLRRRGAGGAKILEDCDCVIDGQAVNAYAEPLVSLDLDIVIEAEDLERVEALYREVFT